MSIKPTAIKLAIFSLVLFLCSALLVVVFGQLRFQRYNTYTAEFSNGSGLRPGQFVRAGGVEVGKVSGVKLTDNGQRVIVDMEVDKALPLYQSTTAQIRYANLIGDRFVNLDRGTGEGADRVLPAGGFIPVARTQPALDLDALIGGFKPLFKSLDPEKVNNIATSLLTVFQGQGGTISDILDQTAQLRVKRRGEERWTTTVSRSLGATVLTLDPSARSRSRVSSTMRRQSVGSRAKRWSGPSRSLSSVKCRSTTRAPSATAPRTCATPAVWSLRPRMTSGQSAA